MAIQSYFGKVSPMRREWDYFQELTQALCAGRVFLQSDIQDAATAMYQEFREHGSDAFCPDGSSVLLCEDSLLAAASTGLASSSASSRLQGHKDPRPDGLSTAEQPLDEQGSSQTGAADSSTSIACEEDTNTEVHHIESSESSSATSSAHDGWPPEIQWLPENPLVSKHPLTDGVQCTQQRWC